MSAIRNSHSNFNFKAQDIQPCPNASKNYTTKTAEVLKHGPKTETADQAMLGALALGGAGVIGDLSGSVRQTFETYHKVYGTENPVALGILGLTTGFNTVSGGCNVVGGMKEIKKADKVSDTAGGVLGRLKVVRGGVQAAGGAVYIPVRALSIAALFTSSRVVSTVAGVLGAIGSICFNIVSVLAGIGIGIRLDEQRKFGAELDAILKAPKLSVRMRTKKAFAHLKQLVAASPQEKEQIRKEVHATRGALNPRGQLKIINAKTKVLLEKKEAKLKRLIGADCVKQIREKGIKEAAHVVEAVQKERNEKVVVSSIAMTLLIIGLISSVVSIIVLGPVGAVVAASISLAVSIGWVLHDGRELLKEFKQSDPGRNDKLWIYISTAIAVVTVALVFFLSGGIAPIIAAGVVGAAWLAINGACYYRLSKFANKHP
jgi:hypothetical protein